MLNIAIYGEENHMCEVTKNRTDLFKFVNNSIRCNRTLAKDYYKKLDMKLIE